MLVESLSDLFRVAASLQFVTLREKTLLAKPHTLHILLILLVPDPAKARDRLAGWYHFTRQWVTQTVAPRFGNGYIFFIGRN